MPSQILHTLFGEDIINSLYNRLEKEFGDRFGLLADKALQKITGDYRGAFVLGCQGPDIFYHNQGRRPVGLSYGSLLHRRGYGIFTAGILKMGLPDPPPGEDDIKNHRREKGINAMGCYALGFMTHAVLDRCCHPYIVYRADRKYHVFFERILDVLMLKRLRGADAAAWDQNSILAGICGNPPLGLKELIARSLAAAYPERAGKDQKLLQRIDNTFADCANFYRLTAPRQTALAGQSKGMETILSIFGLQSLALVFPEKLPDEIDFLNLNHAPWHYPYVPPNSAPATAPAVDRNGNADRNDNIDRNGNADRNDNIDTRSFPDIYAAALEAGINTLAPCIIQYLDSGIFPIAEAARSIGNSCLSIQDENGKPCAPNLTCPLALGEILRQQGRIRGFRAWGNEE